MAEGSELLNALGSAAKERRKTELGLTQETMANDSTLNQMWISQMENGRKNITLLQLARLADALEITMAELLARTERHWRQGERR